MKQPLVSVIMPTYSRSDYLPRAIKSVLNQTYKNVELIVIDDNEPGSEYRKQTENVMAEFIKHKNVKYLKQPSNAGAPAARNRGITESKGEYITFLDDDDEFLPNNIEKEIEFITKNNYDVIFCNLILINYPGEIKQEMRYVKNFDSSRKSLLRKHLVDVISGGIGFIYKREVLLALGGFKNIAASQEYVLMLLTIANGYKVGYFDFAGAIAHRHNSNVRITGSAAAVNAKIEVLKIAKPFIKELDFFDRRKVNYRLNLFICVGLLKRKKITALKYLLKLTCYPDLFIKTITRKKNTTEDVIYI